MKTVINREKGIIKTGIIGIITNVFLVIGKGIVGFIAGSLSIVFDALNNLTDSLNSIITIIGTKLAKKAPDKDHPLGHGRYEYITSLFVGIVIFALGGYSLYETIVRIINPTGVNYSIYTIIVVVLAIFTKIFLGLFTLKQAKKYSSETLVATGKDALFDSLLSLSTLIGVIVSLTAGVNIDGYIGVIITIFILKTGVETIYSALQHLLGKRIDTDLSKKIKTSINEVDRVLGTFDLFIDDYGPTKMTGSAHIEIPSTMTAMEIDELTKHITYKIYKEFDIFLTIGIYAIDVEDEETMNLMKKVQEIVLSVPGVLQMHAFKYYKDKKLVSFDAVRDFEIDSNEVFIENIKEALKEVYPDLEFNIVADLDYAD